ncbi:MAG TPA: hypothetical protein VGL59_26140 [Polyangia bacterium]
MAPSSRTARARLVGALASGGTVAATLAAVALGAMGAIGAIGAIGERSAAAKEHTASCAELPAMITRVRASIEVAGGQRQRGSALGAYQVLRTTAASMVKDSDGDRCGALGRTMSAALRRAAQSRTAVDASVELDLGLDAALSLATDGHPRYVTLPPKLPSVGEAAVYGQDCPDLFPLIARLDGPEDSLSQRVRGVLVDLTARPRCEQVRRLLTSASASPVTLAHAVDSVRLDEPDEAGIGEKHAAVVSRCPELPLVVERLATAIAVGAPQYNAGNAQACRLTYETAVRAITTDVMGVGRCPAVRALLGTGLARATAASTANEAAWALRHSFDVVLSGGAGAAP